MGRARVVVELTREEAFWKFADLDKIKPREHNMLAAVGRTDRFDDATSRYRGA